MKFYEVTEQELNQIREKLPEKISFGFESYGNYFFSEQTVKNINESHGKLLDLTFSQLFNKTEDEFLNEKESTAYESYLDHKLRNQDGLDGYEKILGYIEAKGSLGSSLDNQVIPAYLLITNIRMMMKDGQYKTALRYWTTEIKTLNLFPEDVVSFVESIIENLCYKYGDSEEVVTALKSVPKGSL